ncbi:related to SIT4-associating protein SAP4 [Hanseniaspora guilliermondii]|uniref:Related to SIT4-associating protein SAP4 n=1 Tax=Hanseniaspora guilliermondii TaxID=56406 RepID=A0A1L0B4Q3_9ASCO|nr:related to SIT4-associating protein SAP4 [Hanseniaspora guilliermondii]
MSFWPFGQNFNHLSNNINKILDEYFSVLHTIELKENKQQQEINNGITISKSNLSSIAENANNSTSSSLLYSDIDNDNINSVLTSKFIDEILEENELINELNKKNSTLLDFVCFGYFYDEDNSKVTNIEYLVNLLIHCCDVIDKHNLNIKDETVMSSDDDIIGETSGINRSSTSSPLSLKPSNNITPLLASKSYQSRGSFLNLQSNFNAFSTDYETCMKKCEVISEIFYLNVWLITESLVKNSVFLAKFWCLLSFKSFHFEDSPLENIFLKINTNLLINRQDQFLNFIRSFLIDKNNKKNYTSYNQYNENNDINEINYNMNITIDEIQSISKTKGLVDDMLEHIESSQINDFFLKIISTDKVDTPTGILELVYEQELIRKLLKFFDNKKYNSTIQSCSCDFFKAIIAISANAPIDDLTIGPNVLTRELCSDPEILDEMIRIILHEGGNALGNVVSIVIELIRKNNSDYDQVNLLQTSLKTNPPNCRDPIYLGYMVKKFADNLDLIFDLLKSDYNDRVNDEKIYDLNEDELKEVQSGNTKNIRMNCINEYVRPLGFQNFRIVELIAELLHCSNMGLLNSNKAEHISRKRDKVRSELKDQLEEALNDELKRPESDYDVGNPSPLIETGEMDLPITKDGTNSPKLTGKVPQSAPESSISAYNDETNKDNDEKNEFNENDLDTAFYDVEEQEIYKINEMDEYFDIPYISKNQNDKIRRNCTIGDLFKIRLFDLQILPYLINMFLKYPWNNFWHNVIFDILQQIFNGRMDYAYNSFLVFQLFENKKIFDYNNVPKNEILDFNICRDLIINGYELSNKYYFKNKICLGYMGHLVLIAEEVVKFSKIYKVDLISPEIQAVLDDVKWMYYVEDILMDTRLMFSKILGGDIISTNGQEEEFLLQKQQEKRQRELEEMGMLKDVEENSLLLYSTQNELQVKLKTKLLERDIAEIEKELENMQISSIDNIEDQQVENNNEA